MSQYLSNQNEDAFKSTFEISAQSGSKLRRTVTELMGVRAESQRFPVIGTVNAGTRATSADVVPVGVGNAKPTAHLTPDEAFDYIDIQTAALMSIDATRAYGITLGKAVTRQFDAKILAVLETANDEAYKAPGVTNRIDVNIGASTKFTAATLAEGVENLMEYDFDPEMDELFFVYPASRYSDLTDELKFASSDYLQGMGVTQTGTFKQLYGCEPIWIGNKNRTAGKGRMLDKRAYLYARRAVGLATGVTENLGIVEDIEQKRSVMVGGECNSGAVEIQTAGIIRFVFA